MMVTMMMMMTMTTVTVMMVNSLFDISLIDNRFKLQDDGN